MFKPVLYTAVFVSVFIGVSYLFASSTSRPVPTLHNTPPASIATYPNAQADQYQVSKKIVTNVTLNEGNTVAIIGPIGEESAGIANRITELSQSGKPVYVYINSPGGSVLDGVMIIAAIQASKVPVYTICQGLCASMGAMIFSYGTKRLMSDYSVLMFHEAAGGIQGSFNQIKSRFHVFDRRVGKMDYEIAIRAGMNPEAFRNLLPSELWLDSEDSVNHHFADGLVNIQIQATPRSNFQERLLTSQTKSLNTKVNIHY